MNDSTKLEPVTVQTINEICAAWLDQERMQNSTHYQDCHKYHLCCAITKLLHTIDDLCMTTSGDTNGQ
jgi:hypothetical protein